MTDRQAKNIGLSIAWRKCDKEELKEFTLGPHYSSGRDIVDLFRDMVHWLIHDLLGRD